jgi:hypothetical protein
MEQAAIDQLLLYIMELEEEQLKCVTDHQEALLLDNKETIESTDTVQVSRTLLLNDSCLMLISHNRRAQKEEMRLKELKKLS